jgi:nucleoside-diphosphate-sugar epimerase
MRLILVGRGSFIARHVLQAAQEQDVEAILLPHNTDLQTLLRPTDILVNFALHPAFKSEPYSEDHDCDLRAAHAALSAGARLALLSTRRVYPEASRWNARETGPADGDETFYGRNKALGEKRVTRLLGKSAVIFRLPNVFGFEYAPSSDRGTFVGQLMRSLKLENAIRFDMHPDTRRDFIPVEACASAIVGALRQRTSGTVNLGSGRPVRCGDLANWICEGFGGGELAVDPPVVRDEFFLNVDLWNSQLPAAFQPDGLQAYCVKLGQKLRCARS